MKRIVDMEIALRYIPLATWPEEIGMVTRTLINTRTFINTAAACIVGNLVAATFFGDWEACCERAFWQCVALALAAFNMWAFA
jgi:hypothetical protein